MMRTRILQTAAAGLCMCALAGCSLSPRTHATTNPAMETPNAVKFRNNTATTDKVSKNADVTEKAAIEKIIECYANMGYGEAWRFMNLFWLDDSNLTIVENDRSKKMGPEYIRYLADLIRQRGKHPVNQTFSETQVYFLSDDMAYSVSLREELNIHKTSRVTFVYQKKQGEWRIIHGHFSYEPE